MIGTVINEQYEVLELLGEGGMGVVYKALDLPLDRMVALKFLKGELGDNRAVIKRLRDELKVLAEFNHPNITMLYTSFNLNGLPVMVMELLEGETLRDMIYRRGPIPAQISVPMILQALAGVGEAHRRDIIHRDLKPANLMLNKAGVVKVMDFGIAKRENAAGMTNTSISVGTPSYMAPEQIDPERYGLSRVDARADIYSMGVTLYELLAGEVPFRGATQFSVQRAHLDQQPEPPTVHYPHIPAAVVDAVMRAMEKDPRHRFQSAEEFAAALKVPMGVSAAQDQVYVTPTIVPLPYATAPAGSATVPVPATKTAAERASIPAFAEVQGSTPPPERTTKPVESTPPPTRPEQTARVTTVPPVEVVARQQSIDGPIQNNFGKTAHPRIVGAAVALLVLLLVIGGGLGIHTLLEQKRTQANEIVSTGRSGGGGGGGALSAENTQTNNPGLQLPQSEPAKPQAPANVEISLSVPSAARPDPVIKSEPRIQSEPAPKQPVEGVVAGRWAGSYTGGCEKTTTTGVTLVLSESAGSTPDFLSVSGRLSLASGSQSCSVMGTYKKRSNSLTLRASSCSGATPEFLLQRYASVMKAVSGRQLTGNVRSETEVDPLCMLVSLNKQ